MSNFGLVLRKLREKRGLSVNQLALYSDVSASLVSKIENSKRGVPKPETIEKLAKGLKIKYEDLMHYAGHINSENQEMQDIEDALLEPGQNDAATTIRLIEKEAAKMGLKPNDPSFLKMLEDAFELLRLARGKDTK